MLSLQRLVTICALSFAAAIPLQSHASEAAQTIIGKWRHVSMSRAFVGEAPVSLNADGRTTVEFSENGTWTLTSPARVSKGTYKWLDGQRLEQTVLTSGAAAQVGLVSVKEIRVNTTSLEIITRETREEMDKFEPSKKNDPNRPHGVVITSVFAREN